ncbi:MULTISPECIES: hemolysin family protein [Pasteurellaceae]|uniref:Polyamine export protein n=1 Tax=Pasteurella atlantica TaxID=2827233 RepID=A0AAW8CP50_9PAST|nr:hemolysin family protein [Pasteurella atlantica]MBR0573206.1 HlyC/CorC family transporter [Pasteurella atlantica]MDP8039178.1 hemolysin family protein [Pasteurella atlantica]MDP8041223.1 hemolysin family protein [Pasteurella atlantica]MDP8043360.1 hemolysin family protein [Pasteurella atlantica]MDP8045446.1 hemolysin family protein [Pasteurella atlantica]
MNLFEAILILITLILISAIVSSSEIALAAARKLKLQKLADNGNKKALQILKLQERSGQFITVVQICLNMIAILAGIIGESAISPYLYKVFKSYYHISGVENISSWLSFVIVTFVFVLFADLIPKRVAIIYPEKVALFTVRIVVFFIIIFKPVVWLFDYMANSIFRLFKISTIRDDNMTSEDLFAVVDASAKAGLLKDQEHHLIENILDMQERTVTSAMTTRENIIFLNRSFGREEVLATIKANSHSKLLVCNDRGIDKILGYVESHHLLTLYLQEQSVKLTDQRVLRNVLFIPDTLSLYEVLEQFKLSGEDFAVVVNEYAIVVGIVTLNDVMSIVMGELVSNEEEQIIQRDEKSWLIDGETPLEDVMRALDIEYFPDTENYETIGGFMMYMLRKIPKKTDFVLWDNYKFEIMDTDNFKVDQLLVSIKKED